MSTLWASVMQPGWLPKLHEMTGRPSLVEGVRQWVARGEYQFYAQPTAAGFVVNYTEDALICDAFAAEVSRFALATGESTHTIAQSDRLPSSRAWQLIQWYYAAYYAAHALLRMFGESLTYLERGHAKTLENLSVAYGFSAGHITAGYFRVLVGAGKQVEFARVNVAKGSHDELWQLFARWIDAQAGSVLSRTLTPSLEAQQTSASLGELAKTLRSPPYSNGTWLAHIRNEVTYRHTRNVWYPWKPAHGLPSLVESAGLQLDDAEKELLRVRSAATELKRFYFTCRTIIALCRATCNEMLRRCPAGRSFQAGALAAVDSLARQVR